MATKVKLISETITPTLAGGTLTGDLNFGDSDKAVFGAGSDLQIYHSPGDGHSRIVESGPGRLYINASQINLHNADETENLIKAVADGAVTLYHNGSVKLETSSTGATVTGNLAVTGDLDITGNVNSASVTDLDVTDKTITLGAGQTEALSGGSGIVVDGSGASILWDETNTEFDVNNSINVTGTVTADALTVEGNGSLFTLDNGSNSATISNTNGNVTTDFDTSNLGRNYTIRANSLNTFRISNGGDISFYEDTGTTAKFFWDASAESLGIGTASPDADLEVRTTQSMAFTSDTVNSITIGTSGTNKPCIKFDTADTTHTNRVWAIENGSGDRLNFFRNGLDVLKLNQDGSVEIPGSITNGSAGDTVATFEGSYGTGGDVQLVRYERSGGAVYGAISYKDASTDMEFGNISSHNLSFTTGNTRRMTIMTNGGVEIGDGTNYGYVKVINDSAVVQYLDRRGTDGAVLEIRHADAKDGQINTLSGRMAIGSGDTGIFFDSTRNCISPFDMTTNDGINATIDIGRTGVRFNNAFLEKVTIEGTSNDEGIYLGSNHRIYGGSNRAFEGSTSSGGSVSLGEGYTTGDVLISAPTLLYPATQAYKSDTGIQRYTKTVTVGESATTVLTVTKTGYLYGIAGTITIILFDSGSPWGIYMRKFTIAGRKSTHQAGNNMGYTTGTPENLSQMDYTPTFADSDSRTSGQSGGTITFTVANGSGNGSSGGKIIFDGYISGATLS